MSYEENPFEVEYVYLIDNVPIDGIKNVCFSLVGLTKVSTLSKAGLKVLIYISVDLGHNIEFIDIIFERSGLTKSSFYKGLSELLQKEFLAKTTIPNRYWINPNYFWNGKRTEF